MAQLPLFMTPCRWIKWDLPAGTMRSLDSPRRGIIYLTEQSLEFVGGVKPLSGDLPATAITHWMAKLAGEFTFSLPLRLITEISAHKSAFKIMGKEFTGTYLAVLYKASETSLDMKKLMAYPHFGDKLEEKQKLEGPFFLTEPLNRLYKAEEEARNWVRIIRYQQKKCLGESYAA